jgi:hypothetical protein
VDSDAVREQKAPPAVQDDADSRSGAGPDVSEGRGAKRRRERQCQVLAGRPTHRQGGEYSSGCTAKAARKRQTFRKMVARCHPPRSRAANPLARCQANQKPVRSDPSMAPSAMWSRISGSRSPVDCPGWGERPGDRVLGELVVEAAPSGGGHTTPLATLAVVGSDVRGIRHWRTAATSRQRPFSGGGGWLTGRLGADRVHCPSGRCPDPSRLPLRAAAPALTDPACADRLFRRSASGGTLER